MTDDEEKPAGTWRSTGPGGNLDEYIVGVWYAAFAGMVVMAELVRGGAGEPHELRIQVAYADRSSRIDVKVSGGSEEAIVEAAAERLRQTCAEAPSRVVTPLEYTPIGGNRLVYAEKLAAKPWARVVTKGNA